MITVRKVEPEDMPTLKAWAARRGCALEERLLSPHGFLAVRDNGDPILCAWAALVMDVPIAQVDHVYVARRFSIEEGRAAWAQVIAAIQAFIRLVNERGGFGYSLIEIVMNPVMEKEVTRHGGYVSMSSYKKAHYLIN